MHIGVFDVLNKVLLQRLSGDFKKHYFSAGFFRFFAFAFKTLIFLCWPFLLLVLNFCVFLFCSCCCCCCFTNQVAMFWFLFLLYWVSLVFFSVVCVVFFLVCVWLLWFFWRVKGSVEVAQSPPPKKNMAELLLF